MAKRILLGTVTSTPDVQTIHVEVERFRTHPLYGRRFRLTKTYAVQRTGETVSQGDIVEIEEIRPISKTKHYRLHRLLVKPTPAAAVLLETNVTEALTNSVPENDQPTTTKPTAESGKK